MRRKANTLAVLWVLTWMAACAGTIGPDIPKSVAGGTRFTVLAPTARTVSIVGSFNGWSPTAHRMAPAASDGLWIAVVPLPQGEHAFMYLIDGKVWVSPTLAQDFVTDGFGNTNGIVVVK